MDADKELLRNSWNWEINRLISRTPFCAVHFQMAQALQLPFPVAWTCQMLPLQQVSGWLHQPIWWNLSAINLFLIHHRLVKIYLNPKIFMKHEFSRIFTPTNPQKSAHLTRTISVKNATRNAQATTFFRWRQTHIFYWFLLDLSFRPSSAFCFNWCPTISNQTRRS